MPLSQTLLVGALLGIAAWVRLCVKPSHLGLQPERRCNGTDLQNWTESGFTFVDRKGPAVLSH